MLLYTQQRMHSYRMNLHGYTYVTNTVIVVLSVTRLQCTESLSIPVVVCSHAVSNHSIVRQLHVLR
jgi:hypothetical protein